MPQCTINIKQYLGEHISAICGNRYHNDNDNHCAHFVSHIMGFRFGYKCRNMTGRGNHADAACIRVQEVFAKCPQVGVWDDKPAALNLCLAFVTGASNVNLKSKTMRNHPRKHIGVYYNGKIYHYSNSRNKVVEQIPADYAKHYRGKDITVYYGTLPG